MKNLLLDESTDDGNNNENIEFFSTKSSSKLIWMKIIVYSR